MQHVDFSSFCTDEPEITQFQIQCSRTTQSWRIANEQKVL